MTSDFTIHSLDFEKFNFMPDSNTTINSKKIEELLFSITKWKDARKKRIQEQLKDAYEEYNRNKPK